MIHKRNVRILLSILGYWHVMAVEPYTLEFKSNSSLNFDHLFPDTAFSIAYRKCVVMWQNVRASRGRAISSEQTGELVDHLIALHGAIDCVLAEKAYLLDDLEYLSAVVCAITNEHSGNVVNNEENIVICSRVLLDRLRKKLDTVVSTREINT